MTSFSYFSDFLLNNTLLHLDDVRPCTAQVFALQIVHTFQSFSRDLKYLELLSQQNNAGTGHKGVPAATQQWEALMSSVVLLPKKGQTYFFSYDSFSRSKEGLQAVHK